MNQLFTKLGLAITFSPTGFALLKETKRLKELFQSELVLIHVGERTTKAENLFNETINRAGLNEDDIEIIWAKGDPSNVILKNSKSSGVDLLIAGALEKEKLMKYYIGSVARRIMRSSSSSVLILKSPSENPESFKKFYISVDFSPESEKTVKIAYKFALLENAEEFTLVRDFNIPGLATTILDSGSTEEIEIVRKNWQMEEEEKMRLFINELNLKDLNIKTKCLYGKEGWESSNYARLNKADIYAITAPLKKLKFLDRLFPHEAEYSFENLPSNLLIIR